VRRICLGIIACVLMVSGVRAQTTTRRIAFQFDSHTIAAINSDGTDFQVIADRDVYDGIPYWSPDGAKIAFLSAFKGPQGLQVNLTVADADGGNRHDLPDGDGPNPVRPAGLSGSDPISQVDAPLWSPDGQKLAYYWSSLNRRALYIASADGREPVRMPPSYFFSDVIWSRDGKRLVYIRDDQNLRSLVIYSSDGKLLDETLRGWRLSSFVWSPDETAFLFKHDNDIYRLEVGSRTPVRLTERVNFRSQSWSSDGAYILALRSPGGQPGDVYIMNGDGTDGHAITTQGGITSATWIRNTHHILLYYGITGVRWGLMDVTGKRLRLPAAVERAVSLRWSPDGQQIAFIAEEDGPNRGLYVVNADGTDLRRIADGTGWPAWQPSQ
jgi:Tol biopolymer transport system component